MSPFSILLWVVGGVFVGIPVYLMVGYFIREIIVKAIMGLLGMLCDWEWQFEMGSWDDIGEGFAWTIFCKAFWFLLLAIALTSLVIVIVLRISWIIWLICRAWYKVIKKIWNEEVL